MDIPEYNCGVRQEENKNDKLDNSYLIAVDSGYDSIYNGCASMLMEKSFSIESFDILSPNSIKQTPIKQPSSALKYRISTPKNSATVKRHSYHSFNTSSLKRSKSENNENEPKNVFNTSIRYKPDHFNDSACPFKELHNYDFSPRENILSSTTNHELSFINDSALSISKNLTRCEEEHIESVVPERPTKCLRYVAPLVKHSKRKLDIPPVENKEPGRIYSDGTQILNIIGKLEHFPVVLGGIFKRLSGKDLLNVSLVSKNWNSIVKSDRNASNRIQQYLDESRNFKENLKEPTKPAITHNNRHPFSQFNIILNSKKTEDSTHSSSFFENQTIVQQLKRNERLVKCPRCNRGSLVGDSLARLHSTSFNFIFVHKTATSDLTFVNKKANSICDKKGRDDKIDEELPQTFEDIGFCPSVGCKYKFCLKCSCEYHPGKNCIPSKPESPSKLIICHKKLKNENKSNSKLSSKRQGLKRLCFS